MNCTNCGKEVKKGKTFCTDCGATIEQQEATVQQGAENKKFIFLFQSKKSKILAIVILILVVLGFGGYITIQTMNKPIEIVQQFEKVVETKNAKELTSLLNNGQESMDVQEVDAKMLLNYFDENPDLLAKRRLLFVKKHSYLKIVIFFVGKTRDF